MTDSTNDDSWYFFFYNYLDLTVDLLGEIISIAHFPFHSQIFDSRFRSNVIFNILITPEPLQSR